MRNPLQKLGLSLGLWPHNLAFAVVPAATIKYTGCPVALVLWETESWEGYNEGASVGAGC